MPGTRIFLDTFFVQALLNAKDEYHQRAQALQPHVERAGEIVITEPVLVEIGNALSGNWRDFAAAFIRRCFAEPSITVVPVDTELLMRALHLYESRSDKDWGLTDCISFVVMRDRAIFDVATGDKHFRQAGFRPLLLESQS